MKPDYLKSLCLLLVCVSVGAKTNKTRGQSKKTRKCGGSTDRIEGGRPAGAGEFPYQVSIRRTSDGEHYCGGSVISNQWILTAAGCVFEHPPSSIIAIVGTNYLNSGGTAYSISQVISQGGYYPDNNDLYDIAVLKVNGTIQMSSTVGIVPLAFSNPPDGSVATLSGWGGTNYSSTALSNQLQAINLPTLSFEDCQGYFPDYDVSFSICTLSPAGRGACEGDSGGPLVFNGSQIGVLSWNMPCAQRNPNVFTNVADNRRWIQSNTDYYPEEEKWTGK